MAQKFKTWHDKHERNFSPVGAKIEIRHRAVMHENGRRELVADKKVAIYDLIQASKEDCEIENIIRRAVEGDYNALNLKKGTFIDITDCPSSIAEAQQMIIDLKLKFDELPKEIKAKFDYNPEIYVAEFGTDDWAEKTGYKAAYEAEQKAIDSEKALTQNFAKAIENIASGTGEVITQKGEITNE